MDAPRCRRFDLGDVAILAATVVATVALMPANWFDEVGMRWVTGQPRFAPTLGGDPGPRSQALDLLILTSQNLTWLWSGATLGFLGFRLRGPRPSVAVLGAQPGFLAGTLALVMASSHFGLAAIRWGLPRPPLDLGEWSGLGARVATALVGGWLALWLSGRWRPEPGWIDRLGRGLGWTWIATYLFEEVAWAINMRG